MNSNPSLARIANEVGTPFWVYDAATIRRQIAALRQFDIIRFAQKACSNIHLLRLIREEGVLVDAVSLGEIERALAAGYLPGRAPAAIVFTADLLDRSTIDRVIELNIPVNAGSPQMLEQMGESHPGHRVWIRVNPGFGHGHSQKTNTGGEHSKHGIWHEHLRDSLRLVDRYRLELEGLHVHIGSGVDYAHLQGVAEAMIQFVKSSGCEIGAISAGGGLSIPYRPGESRVDTAHYFETWNTARKQIELLLGHKIRLEIEPGRFLVAEAGRLVGEVRAKKDVGSNFFVLIDAGFNDLMRPAMYGSYHEISFFSPEGMKREGSPKEMVVAGPLCESGDVFTQEEGGIVSPRLLPEPEIGDFVVIHNAGAYGASMSSNYNTRPLLPEVLLEENRGRVIRRRQTINELLALESDFASGFIQDFNC
jgi:diaminopimelate decarboxylase